MLNVPGLYDKDGNSKKLEDLWGDAWNKLTPRQRQLVSEILSSSFVPPQKVDLAFLNTKAINV